MPIRIDFTLGSKVLHQRRSVQDLASMMGDIGGLYDSVALVLAGLLLPISEHLQFMKII